MIRKTQRRKQKILLLKDLYDGHYVESSRLKEVLQDDRAVISIPPRFWIDGAFEDSTGKTITQNELPRFGISLRPIQWVK